MEKVSIIVPIYNVEKYIKRCLESIVKQDYGSFEIICVDDCGQDKSMEIVTEFQKKYPDKLVIVHNPVNKGLGAARDAGMKAASGEYIGFIDSDDYIKPDFISRYIEAFRSSLSDVVAGGYIRDENGKYTELPSDVEDAEAIWVNVSACLKMYRRSFLEKHHLNFNGVRRYEDEGFMYRILMKNPKVKVIPYSGYYYWLNTESITRSKNNDRAGIFLEYASNVEEMSRELLRESTMDNHEILCYCLASGLIANLLYNGRGCGIHKMKELYEVYNKVMLEISDRICINKYIKLKYLKSEPVLKRYAAWLVLRFRKIKADKLLFLIDSLL